MASIDGRVIVQSSRQPFLDATVTRKRTKGSYEAFPLSGGPAMAATDKSLARPDKSRTPVTATNMQATARRFPPVDAQGPYCGSALPPLFLCSAGQRVDKIAHLKSVPVATASCARPRAVLAGA
jgi:hypothetical protein